MVVYTAKNAYFGIMKGIKIKLRLNFRKSSNLSTEPLASEPDSRLSSFFPVSFNS